MKPGTFRARSSSTSMPISPIPRASGPQGDIPSPPPGISPVDSVSLLDARAGDRYRGEVEPVDPAAGHIPTALSLPTGGNLAPNGRFLPEEELEARFRAIGIEPGTSGDNVITSCGSGVTACHTALAMRLAELRDPILYPGSFSDWSRAGLPVASGAEPGARPSSIAASARSPARGSA